MKLNTINTVDDILHKYRFDDSQEVYIEQNPSSDVPFPIMYHFTLADRGTVEKLKNLKVIRYGFMTNGNDILNGSDKCHLDLYIKVLA